MSSDAPCSMSRQILAFVSPTLYCEFSLRDHVYRLSNRPAHSYIVHSAFAIMCPLHFLFLLIQSKHSPRAIFRGLYACLCEHIAPTIFDRPGAFPTWGFVRLGVILSISIAIPALLWFVAVTQAPLVVLSSVTLYLPHAYCPDS